MTELDGGALVASGHPDLRLEKYRVENRPSFLGRLGEADFHALVAGDDRLFAAETSGRIWRQEGDGEWVRLGEVETFHVDDGRWWITIHGGAIAHSDDRGTTWTDTYLPPERP